MSWAREAKRWTRAALPPLVFLAIAGYFGWSATQGDHGLEAKAHRQDQLRLAHADVVRATTDQEVWEHRVSALRIGRLDPDALDERARAMLNLADPADVVIMYGPGKKLF